MRYVTVLRNGATQQRYVKRDGGCRPFFVREHAELARSASRFDMLLDVRKGYPRFLDRQFATGFPRPSLRLFFGGMLLALSAPLFWQFVSSAHNLDARQTQTPAAPASNAASNATVTTPAQGTPAPAQAPNNFPANLQSSLLSSVLNTVVLDAAHGGTDLGARGTGGIRESEVVLEFAAQIRRALEAEGLRVVQTRLGNENPSFDDRSAMANAQRGTVFVTIHISSTGLAGTARVYVNSDLTASVNTNGLIPWDQAQAPFLGLSRKFGDLVQGLLAQRFKGSPNSSQTASVRQLRTTAAPAIAVEISSVSVEKREDLDRMAPGVADAIARGVAAFKPSYVVPSTALPIQTSPGPAAGTSAPATRALPAATRSGVSTGGTTGAPR